MQKRRRHHLKSKKKASKMERLVKFIAILMVLVMLGSVIISLLISLSVL